MWFKQNIESDSFSNLSFKEAKLAFFVLVMLVAIFKKKKKAVAVYSPPNKRANDCIYMYVCIQQKQNKK